MSKFFEEIEPLSLEDEIPFGNAHKGDQVEDVIEDDPDYIEWLYDEGMKFTEEAMAKITAKGIV